MNKYDLCDTTLPLAGREWVEGPACRNCVLITKAKLGRLCKHDCTRWHKIVKSRANVCRTELA